MRVDALANGAVFLPFAHAFVFIQHVNQCGFCYVYFFGTILEMIVIIDRLRQSQKEQLGRMRHFAQIIATGPDLTTSLQK